MTELSGETSPKLRKWYRVSARDLPWRVTDDIYKIWISEIILQQTQVAQGLGYYNRFINRFPDVRSLAKATENEVLKLWEGLGYYSRARNLHRGARQIHLHGSFPGNYNDWLKIPGVGPYTAAAISSFAFGEEQAVVDGNVNRVISRLMALDEPPDTTAGKKIIRVQAQKLLAGNPPAEHNQAMMELGATVCTPRNPACTACPLESECLARQLEQQHNYPLPKSKITVGEARVDYTALYSAAGLWIRKRPGQGIWGGLHELLPVHPEELQLPGSAIVSDRIHRVEHRLTHRKLDIHIHSVQLDQSGYIYPGEARFCNWPTVNSLAFPQPVGRWLREKLLPLHLDIEV